MYFAFLIKHAYAAVEGYLTFTILSMHVAILFKSMVLNYLHLAIIWSSLTAVGYRRIYDCFQLINVNSDD